MNILFVSKDLSGGDLAYRLKKEGHNVKFFIEDETQRHNFEGMVEKIDDWKKELNWVGKKDGLIVFDDTGFGKIQDKLRKEGYSVVGGCEEADRMEDIRHHGQKIMVLSGIQTIPSQDFNNIDDAIEFVKNNQGPWVVKQNGHVHKTFNYVGQLENGEDVIEVLKNYNRNNREDCSLIELQKKIVGIEMGVGRYFNGNDWVGPIEVNLEHKSLCEGGLGPKTFEMGTLIWYDNNKKNKLFQQTLGKMKKYLKSIDFRGDIDINCIIEKDKAWPLEITARFGWPATHLHEEIHISPWGEFLKAVADGKPYDLKYKKGFGIVVLVATPPFPYNIKLKKFYPNGIKILSKKGISKDDLEHIHFEEVSILENNGVEEYQITSKTGFILHVTGMGKTVSEAREKTYKIINNLVIPKMFYRKDIGLKFMQKEQKILKEFGWMQ